VTKSTKWSDPVLVHISHFLIKKAFLAVLKNAGELKFGGGMQLRLRSIEGFDLLLFILIMIRK
jgi:hypothetical protein